MKTYGINLNSVLPMRSEANEKAEMCSQLLFGDHFEILEETDKFTRIHNIFDDYEGWVDKTIVSPLDKESFKKLSKPQRIIGTPIATGFVTIDNDSEVQKILLPGGSILPFLNEETGVFRLCSKSFRICINDCTPIEKQPNNLITIARDYLNSPYLWGGRTILGIDCSGFTQNVFRIAGYKLPRDAAQQAEMGKEVYFEKIKVGDLLFFGHDNDKITHVGIAIGGRRLIHASGRVKIEHMNNQGIIHETSGAKTHNLICAKRII